MAGQPGAERDLSAQVGDPLVVSGVFDQLRLAAVALTGPDHRIVATTGAYRAFTGRRDMIGKAVPDLFPEAMGQQIVPIFDRVYTSGQSESLRELRVQVEIPIKGQLVEYFVDVNANPFRGPEGDVIGVLVDVVDVSERVRGRQTSHKRAVEAERRYEQARDLVDAVQRELLPTGVPVLPRVQIAATYLLADVDTAAGGDWFDALVLPDGRTALVVGDVVGHGVAASATMGQLRIVLHEQLANNTDITAGLSGLDAAADRIRGARAATVCVVLLDPDTGALEYCTAGHPPPLVVSTSGNSRYLPATGAGPVGVGGEFLSTSIGRDRLADDELVLLYTDGILERPGREPAQSTVELAEAAGDIAANRALRGDTDSPVERVCTQTLELLIRVTGHTDDITLLAGQRATAPPDLDLQVVATPASLAIVRERFDQWMTGARVSDDDAHALRHAMVELATNAIEHAYVDSADVAVCTITAALADTGRVSIQVADQGHWRDPAPSPDRGLGLQLTEALVDSVRVEHNGHGTTATVSHRLRQPARLLTAVEVPWRPPEQVVARRGALSVEAQAGEENPRI
ncbi:ATP-binding SpoIIE family protein phosphatase, partial [Aldersonia kunmingensis]|uniref:ATP-binding SpoIIE family protein phosphatase n=1 Tax=Aldersonia kunmingensis TaxID=408066 RepID=UPI000831FECE